MSFTPFLNSVAEALMQRVRPSVADVRSRDALDACVRALAGMAAALEVPADDLVAALPLPPGGPAPRAALVLNPPESLAANDQTAARMAVAEGWLAEGGWLDGAADHAMGLAMLEWERGILRDKIAGMMAIESGGADADAGLASLLIDRDALERYFATRCGDARISAFAQTVGGRSRQTAVFTLEGETGLPRLLVVQRDHPASISPGVALQYPVLELIARSSLKTATPLLLETDRAILGAPFMILEQVPGRVAGPDYFAPPQSPALALELAAQLAILHAIDARPVTGGVSTTLGPETPDWTQELARVEARWAQFQHAPSLAIAAALAWMRAHVGSVGPETAIVHNDAAFHNILAVDGRFSALLDWELVHIGHPAEDLGYVRAFVQEMTDWDGFMAAYVQAGGQRFPKQVIDFFSLRAGVHLMTLLQFGRHMFTTGATSDINLAEAATYFIPRHHARIATMVGTILES